MSHHWGPRGSLLSARVWGGGQRQGREQKEVELEDWKSRGVRERKGKGHARQNSEQKSTEPRSTPVKRKTVGRANSEIMVPISCWRACHCCPHAPSSLTQSHACWTPLPRLISRRVLFHRHGTPTHAPRLLVSSPSPLNANGPQSSHLGFPFSPCSLSVENLVVSYFSVITEVLWCPNTSF